MHVNYLTEVLPGPCVLAGPIDHRRAADGRDSRRGSTRHEAGIGSPAMDGCGRPHRGADRNRRHRRDRGRTLQLIARSRLAGQPLTRAVKPPSQKPSSRHWVGLGSPVFRRARRYRSWSLPADPRSRLSGVGIGVASGLVLIGGLVGAAGIRNPRRVLRASQCPGGQPPVHRSTPRGSTPPQQSELERHGPRSSRARQLLHLGER